MKISHKSNIILHITALSDDWMIRPTYGFFLYQSMQFRNIIRASGADQGSSYSNCCPSWLMAFWLKRNTTLEEEYWHSVTCISWNSLEHKKLCTSWKMSGLLKRKKSPTVRRKGLLDIFYKNNSCDFLICRCDQLWLLLSLFNYSLHPIQICSFLFLSMECYVKTVRKFCLCYYIFCLKMSHDSRYLMSLKGFQKIIPSLGSLLAAVLLWNFHTIIQGSFTVYLLW